ncbi:MAG: Ig-like domain-containing protein [Gemmatimonadales bacterium]
MRRRPSAVLVGLLAVLGCAEDPVVAPPVATSLQVVSGNSQSGTPGFRLGAEVVVRLVDQRGDPVAGATINFASTESGAVAEPNSAVTDAEGVARTAWRLGSGIGTQRLAATVAGQEIPAANFTAAAGSQSPRSVTGGGPGMCVVHADGVLRCGLPPTLGATNPTWAAVGGALRFNEVVLVDDTAIGMKGCAIAESGRIWCFSLGVDGAVTGLAELAGSYPMLHGLSGSGVSTHVPAYCGLSAVGEGYCWGRNDKFQLGFIPPGDIVVPSPTPINTTERFTMIEIGWEGGCALTAVGEVWCWGRNRQGQTGQVPPTTTVLPARLATSTRFSRIAMGDWDDTACGVAITGGLWCWGLGTGMRGTDVTTPIGRVPVAIPGRENATDLTQIAYTLVTLNGNRTGSAWGGLSFVEVATVSTEFVNYTPIPISNFTNRTGRDATCGTAAGASGTLCVAARSLVTAKYPGAGPLPAVFGIPAQ